MQNTLPSKMNSPSDLIDEPPEQLIKPTLMITINGMDDEHDPNWSKQTLKELDNVDEAIAEVEEVLQRIDDGSLDTSQTCAWIVNMLHNTTYSNAARFNLLAIVLNRHCQTINNQGDGISQAEFDLTSLLIEHINKIWNNKPYELKLGES